MQKQLTINIWKSNELPFNWYNRTEKFDKNNYKMEKDIKQIIQTVKNNGDASLIEFTQKFDKVKLNQKQLLVTADEIKAAYKSVSNEQISALKFMKRKIIRLEKKTLSKIGFKTSEDGITVENVFRPIESVGCYVPGGQATYPSTVMMTAIPAKVAGVPRIVVCSPPTSQGTINPLTLVAADICEVNQVFKVGGVQSIAALAYGTETINPVKKIVGPGSKFVTLAKILVSKDVAIDMPAGPSEVLILADDTADPSLIGVDMISQSEHGNDSVSGLITTSEKLAYQVVNYLKTMTKSASREEIVREALTKYGFVIICKNNEEMINLANIFAPEHLEIITQNARGIAEKINSAGLILVGPYSPTALSDYGSGTNHVLPTGGFGHSYSGLSVFDFIKKINIVESTKEGLIKIKNQVKNLTAVENLPNHYKAIEKRFDS